MKNSNYIINGVLAVAIIVLFILHFTGKGTFGKSSDAKGIAADSAEVRLPIAYVRSDSLLINCKFFNNLNDAVLKKLEDRRLQYSQKVEQLNKDYIDFQQKAQANLFLTQERQVQEQNRLLSKKQDLDALADQIDKEISAEQRKVSIQVQDTIISTLKQFNNPKKYQLILSNSGTDNILYADEAYDITKEVIDFLNARLPSK